LALTQGKKIILFLVIHRVKLPAEIEDLLPDGEEIFTESYRPCVDPLADIGDF